MPYNYLHSPFTLIDSFLRSLLVAQGEMRN
jgi:hypothetical protein